MRTLQLVGFRTASFLIVLLSLCPNSHAVEIGNWKITQYPASGTKTGCLMSSPYKSGTVLGLLVSRQYQWGLALMNSSWRLDANGVTPVSVSVDGKLLTSNSATHIGGTMAYLPLTDAGARGYKALQVGRQLDITTPVGNMGFDLTGTSRAMAAVLDCVDMLNGRTAPPATATVQPEQDFQMVSQVEATVMLTNLLNSSGTKSYRLEPPKRDDAAARFVLADGTQGYFVASRGKTRDTDDYVGWVIDRLSQSCKGDFVSGKQNVPSTDGSVVRKVAATCKISDGVTVTESTIIRRPNGFLMNLTQTLPLNVTSTLDGSGHKDREALVEAAMRLPESR